MAKWFKRNEQDNEPQRPMPRWLSWVLFGFIGYLVIVGNVSTTRAPETTVAASQSPTEQAAVPKDFPAIRRTFSLANWQRAFDPGLTEGLKVRDFTMGNGRQAACGDEVTLKLRGRNAKGEPFDPKHDETKPLSFTIGDKSTYPAVEQAVVGMKQGGERIVDAPPALVYAEGFGRDLSALTLELNLEKLNPAIPEKSAPLLLATNRIDGEAHKSGALCGERIGVAISLWDERGEKSRKLQHTELVLGARELAIGLDHALPGIVVGETRTILLPPAYHLHKGNNSPFEGKTFRLVEVTRTK